MIDWSDENTNGDDSIRVSREFDSNEIDESDWQYEKHEEPRISVRWFFDVKIQYFFRTRLSQNLA
jgi:hypothetical protein